MSNDELCLLAALRGQRLDRAPVWFMRQAGRHLPEYHEVRGQTSMLEACLTPDLAAEITLQPVRRYGMDGAIFYSDIVIPLALAGVDVSIQPGRGPVMGAGPLRDEADVQALIAHRVEDWAPISEAVGLVASELRTSLPGTTLLGFAGAPFTLASYLVEGGPSRDHLRTRAFMHTRPDLWQRLAQWCADLSGQFLSVQIAAGAQGVQLFDSWAGGLSLADYREFVAPYSRSIFTALGQRHPGVPRIHFAVGASHLAAEMAVGADVLGVDWRIDLGAAAAAAPGLPLQGNLDPAVLFEPAEVASSQVDSVLRAGLAAPAHIFNLGHGVPKDADPGRVQAIVDQVKGTSLRDLAAGGR